MTSAASSGQKHPLRGRGLPVALPTRPHLRGLVLEPLFTHHPWLGPVTLACVIAVWACLDSYLECLP